VPVSLGVKWLTDVWDQCGGLHATSPINAKLEEVCEKWLVDLFHLPQGTVAGFVSGTSMANLTGLAAARYHVLDRLDWDISAKGLRGAPAFRVLAHEQCHTSIRRTLVMLGIGSDEVEWIPSDSEGRIIVDAIPKLDASCIVILQAGNVNSGAFDDFDTVCDAANQAGAWVHIDGAFGLWAAATQSLAYLMKGMEKASSWAVDGHKTLNTPYDSGIILCRHRKSMLNALKASGAYLVFDEYRDPILYSPEMSKRSRAIELWATMKYLGKDGIDQMVTRFHELAKFFAKELVKIDGFEIVNEVVFNQVLVQCKSDAMTIKTMKHIQELRECWVGGSVWRDRKVIRVSICSWMTTEADLKRSIKSFEKALSIAGS
jgi:glutamate/tyrosine decarboxylase-like PLP-dependent enzyme